MDRDDGPGMKRSIGKALLFGSAAVPFFLSIVFHAIGAVSQRPAKPSALPALAFDQYLVNLGQAEPGGQVAGQFTFTNTSDRPVSITELKPSCGCLNPRLEKKVYQPAERGEFSLRVQTANEAPGPKEYYCDVKYDDGRAGETRLTFRVILPDETVTVRPSAVIVYQSNATPTERTLVVTDRRPQPLRVLAVECSSELASVSLGTVGTDDAGRRRQEVFVTIGAVPPGRHHALVRIRTDDPAYPDLRVPMLIEGPDRPPERSATHTHNTHR